VGAAIKPVAGEREVGLPVPDAHGVEVAVVVEVEDLLPLAGPVPASSSRWS